MASQPSQKTKAEESVKELLSIAKTDPAIVAKALVNVADKDDENPGIMLNVFAEVGKRSGWHRSVKGEYTVSRDEVRASLVVSKGTMRNFVNKANKYGGIGSLLVALLSG